jgi:hypothetical protein
MEIALERRYCARPHNNQEQNPEKRLSHKRQSKPQIAASTLVPARAIFTQRKQQTRVSNAGCATDDGIAGAGRMQLRRVARLKP